MSFSNKLMKHGEQNKDPHASNSLTAINYHSNINHQLI